LGISLPTDNLRRTLPDGEKNQDIRCLQAAHGVIQAVLTSLNATLGSGKQVQYSKFNLPKLIDSVINAGFNHSVSPRNQKLITKGEVSVSPEVEQICTDKNRLFLALSNCVSNSIQALDEGNPAFREGQNRLTIRATKETIKSRDFLKIEVEDTGCGFDLENKSKLFEYWYSTKGDHGTGLGVPTTRDIVEELGGTFDLTSEGKGKGAKATILIPLKTGEKT
jgi:signal transduction histidine kinase